MSGCAVVKNKNEYISKTKSFLADSNTCKCLNRDPTAGIQRKHNELIKKLKSQKELNVCLASLSFISFISLHTILYYLN